MKLLKIRNFIVNWLKKYSEENSNKNLVVGISGGIDSALTSTLCAMTGLKTIILSMPIHQKKDELDNANKHAKWLSELYPNTENITMDLTSFFEAYKENIPIKFHSNLGLANSKSRIRMMTLYQVATKQNSLVVGTGNRVEDFGIGFFTKHGDGGVDISPIGDLKKSEVKKLAEFCGIIKEILDAPPTDGLWEDGRTDEKQIGATYEELEWAMDYNGKKELTKREKEVLEIYNKLIDKNQHKMSPIPVCIIPNELCTKL